MRRRLQNLNFSPSSYSRKDFGHRKLPDLPHELVVEILTRLPVKSLWKLRCVSKSWRSLISNPQFVEAHLEKSSKNDTDFTNHHLILARQGRRFGTVVLKQYSLLSALHDQPGSGPLKGTHVKFSEFNSSSMIVGSCNGLLCIVDKDSNDFFLWNPSIRKLKKLPELKFEYQYLAKGNMFYHHRTGFGYDKGHHDYKVVAMFGLAQPGPKMVSVCKVYSQKSNSWRSVEDYDDDVAWSFYPGTFANGRIYWSRVDSLSKLEVFDLSDDIFERVELPEFIFNNGGCVFITLGVLEGCIALLRHNKHHVCNDLWKMVKHGPEQSWTKVVSFPGFNIPPRVDGFPILVFCSSNGEILLDNGKLFVLLDAKKISHRIVDCRDGFKFRTHLFVESLVLPDPSDS